MFQSFDGHPKQKQYGPFVLLIILIANILRMGIHVAADFSVFFCKQGKQNAKSKVKTVVLIVSVSLMFC